MYPTKRGPWSFQKVLPQKVRNCAFPTCNFATQCTPRSIHLGSDDDDENCVALHVVVETLVLLCLHYSGPHRYKRSQAWILMTRLCFGNFDKSIRPCGCPCICLKSFSSMVNSREKNTVFLEDVQPLKSNSRMLFILPNRCHQDPFVIELMAWAFK